MARIQQPAFRLESQGQYHPEIDYRQLQRYFATVDARDIQKVIDQSRQVTDFFSDNLADFVGRPRWPFAQAHDLDRVANRRERIA